MIRSDYIMRMIEQLSRVLVQIVFHKKNGEYELAVIQINTALKSLVGLDPEIIRTLPAEEIIRLLHIGDQLEAGKCLVIAKLLKERTEILQLSDPTNQSLSESYQKSLSLYLEAILSIPDFKETEYLQDVNELISLLEGSMLSQSVKFKLFRYYDWSGEYARADNLLFELIEVDYPEIKTIGILFYRRLQKKSDADLVLGGLPRPEVEEGLREISDHKK